MRWKLLVITSLTAALLSACGMYAYAYLLKAHLTDAAGQFSLSTGLVIITLAVTTLASIFVYRHTARRRKLQAALTALLSLILTVATLFTVARIVFRRAVEVRARTAAMPHGRSLT